MNCYSSLLKWYGQKRLGSPRLSSMHENFTILPQDWLQKQESQNKTQRRNLFEKILAGGRQKGQNTWTLRNDHPMFCQTGSGFILLKGQTSSWFIHKTQLRLFEARLLSWPCQQEADYSLFTAQPCFKQFLFQRDKIPPSSVQARESARRAANLFQFLMHVFVKKFRLLKVQIC